MGGYAESPAAKGAIRRLGGQASWRGLAAVLVDPERGRGLLQKGPRSRAKEGEIEIWVFSGSGWGARRDSLLEASTELRCCCALQETKL